MNSPTETIPNVQLLRVLAITDLPTCLVSTNCKEA